jgi:hypothetical protein
MSFGIFPVSRFFITGQSKTIIGFRQFRDALSVYPNVFSWSWTLRTCISCVLMSYHELWLGAPLTFREKRKGILADK